MRKYLSFNGSFMRRWPTVLAVVIGIAAALFAATQLRVYVNTHKEMVRVPVPKHNIAPYTVITPQDIGWREIVKGGEEPESISDPSEAVGKLTRSTLYQNEQIKKERLGDAELVKDKQIISLNIDVTRSIGGWLQVGDLVDVWWIPTEGYAQIPGSGWQCVAANAIILDLRDSAGRTVISSNKIDLQSVANVSAGSASPAVAILAVSSFDVPRVVGGASPNSQNVVLVKKFTKETTVQPEVVEE